MIATIVLGLIMLAGFIVYAIYKIIDDDCGFGIVAFAVVVVCGMLLASAYTDGILPSEKDREYVIYCLEDETNVESIKKAIEYNDDILEGNNYWCRFRLYEEEEYLIDIEYYLKKETEVSE